MLGKVAVVWVACLAVLWSDPELVKPEFVIEWTGSAYKDGDAFVVTAEIRPKRVDLRWDGFAGPAFDFMDEGEKERTQRTFRFQDPETVEAFRSLARNSEWADVGGPTALGQGVCIGVEVQASEGKILREMDYFGTMPQYVMARRYQQIPWDLKEVVAADDEAEAKAKFTQSLRLFADDLAIRGSRLKDIEEAYKMEDDFPHEAFSKIAEVPPYEEFHKLYGGRYSPAPAKVHTLVRIVGEALKDCLDPSRRMALLSKDTDVGACLVQVDVMSLDYGESVAVACLPKKSDSAHYRVISKRAEELLLRFISGGKEIGRFPAPVSCRLKLEEGVLVVDEGRLWLGEGELELDQEMEHRLAWLNKQRAFQGLASELDEEAETPAWLLHFTAIRVHPHDRKRVKFDYSFGGSDYVVEARFEDGEWTPGKRWDDREYYLQDGVYHNSTDFRPDDP